jgi:predicted DNA-binding protein with PD1-like motif
MKSKIAINAGVFFLFLFLLSFRSTVMAQSADTLRYVKVPVGYLMVLQQGDDVFKELEKLASSENIPSANLTGMGFVNAEFGFFDFKTKEYKPRMFNNVEMASMTGSIAWQEGKVSLHLHGIITDDSFKAAGGHLLKAIVSTGSLEVLVTVHPNRLERKIEQPLGANVLQLNH